MPDKVKEFQWVGRDSKDRDHGFHHRDRRFQKRWRNRSRSFGIGGHVGVEYAEGDDHTSRLAAKGYNNVLFILLYPALAVAGFFVAAKISQVVLPVALKIAIGGLWGDLDEPGAWTSITNMIFLLIGLLVVCWHGVTISYQLIEGMPVAVLGWISVSEPGLNPFANLHNSASRVIGGMVASHGPGVMRAGYRGFKGGVSRALGDLGKIRTAFDSTKSPPSIRNE